MGGEVLVLLELLDDRLEHLHGCPHFRGFGRDTAVAPRS
ncbi:hypothetical protein ATKI12_5621 [Kitasatospora sp. Ki12]